MASPSEKYPIQRVRDLHRDHFIRDRAALGHLEDLIPLDRVAAVSDAAGQFADTALTQRIFVRHHRALREVAHLFHLDAVLGGQILHSAYGSILRAAAAARGASLYNSTHFLRRDLHLALLSRTLLTRSTGSEMP